MIKIPMNFKRALDEAPRLKSCESSGSDHSADLSDLVNSFLEREIGEEMRGDEVFDQDHKDGDGSDDDVETLKSLFSHDNDAVRRTIQEEVDKACGEASGIFSSSPDFKRRLMARLRSRGFDAGICKSKREKDSGRGWALGNYEYIDVEAGEGRYIVEILLAGEFRIARPSSGYASLVNVLPEIYVGRAEELRKVVRVMCNGIRRSMKSAGMHVPPWRRGAYIKSKWFASYKRTTNQIPSLDNSMLSRDRFRLLLEWET